jgi:exonuclease III
VVNSFNNKRTEVRLSIDEMKLGIVALQETRVKTGDWPLTLPGFQVFEVREDPNTPGARGLAIGVVKSLGSHLVESTLHWQLVKVHGLELDKPWHVMNVYIPHNQATKTRVIRSLRQRVERLLNQDPDARIVILGDLNCAAARAQTIIPRNYGFTRLRTVGSDKTYHRYGKWTGIDHFLGSTSVSPLLTCVRVWRKFDASDHFPLVAKVNLEITRPKGKEEKIEVIDRSALIGLREGIINDDLWKGNPDGEQGTAEWLDAMAKWWDETS